MTIDAVKLAQDLIRCRSVTPDDAGVLGVLEAVLRPLGFECHRLKFDQPGTAPVENLYARLGTTQPNFCFAGHTDVVPPGDAKLWQSDPFAPEIRAGKLYGRGAADMKTAIACFVAAAARHGTPKGSISLLITNDEEGPTNINGTKKVLRWLKERGEQLDHCIVGEPTSTATSGDVLKIGRRGTMNAKVRMVGVQGHVAYPQQANNPIPAMAELVMRLSTWKLDEGTPHFAPSTLAFTSIDVGNLAANVIPAEVQARFNIRFNDLHRSENLVTHIETQAREIEDASGVQVTIESNTSGEPFLTKPGPFIKLLCDVVKEANGQAPDLSTTGGTSDARFIKDMCPVVEMGLPGGTMHKANECVAIEEIAKLTDLYARVLGAYFANPPA